ncbi:MAG: sulfite exporter TauE/SafE family protein [Desulfobacteraceae bacterium]|nr:MAG: sulfite exporter TauE/SafE family protein [Desulfobacteraceae bacterium]
MSELDLTSMFLLGLTGTGHCLGMCGPLVLAFPALTGRFSSHIFYQMGRTATYVLIGVVMGAVSAGLSFLAQKAGSDPLTWVMRVQVGLSIFAAIFLVVFGLSRLGFLPEPEWMSFASPSRIPGFQRVVGSATQTGDNAGMLLMGMVFGFIPCGLSFAAFARALAAGGPIKGGMLTLAFAAGTLPGLLLLGTGLSPIASRYRRLFDLLSGAIMIGIAVSLLMKTFSAILR